MLPHFADALLKLTLVTILLERHPQRLLPSDMKYVEYYITIRPSERVRAVCHQLGRSWKPPNKASLAMNLLYSVSGKPVCRSSKATLEMLVIDRKCHIVYIS